MGPQIPTGPSPVISLQGSGLHTCKMRGGPRDLRCHEQTPSFSASAQRQAPPFTLTTLLISHNGGDSAPPDHRCENPHVLTHRDGAEPQSHQKHYFPAKFPQEATIFENHIPYFGVKVALVWQPLKQNRSPPTQNKFLLIFHRRHRPMYLSLVDIHTHTHTDITGNKTGVQI